MNKKIKDELEEDLDNIDESEDPLDVDIDDENSDDIIDTSDISNDDELTNDSIELSKHKLQGKHSLKYDSIFKGKKDDPLTEETSEYHSGYNEKFEVDKSSQHWRESIDNENYIKDKRIRERVYDVLSENTEINFLNNRRKPSKVDFNIYYCLLKTKLHKESFTNVELFNELAVYFSDNLFNMFKLLDNKWRNLIISELQDHVGKQTYSNEIRNRNIYEGTEIEFLEEDIKTNDMIHITGVVIETDYDNCMFEVNSYEKIYKVKLESVTKILNNTKFKYNLNKLNNIDFL